LEGEPPAKVKQRRSRTPGETWRRFGSTSTNSQ
jgi:hypothetical protein